MQKRLDGHQVSRCGRGGSGLPARLGRAWDDGASTENLRPLPGLKPLDAAPPPPPPVGRDATCPPSLRRSPAHCTHSVWHVAALVVASCADSAWYESWSIYVTR